MLWLFIGCAILALRSHCETTTRHVHEAKPELVAVTIELTAFISIRQVQDLNNQIRTFWRVTMEVVPVKESYAVVYDLTVLLNSDQCTYRIDQHSNSIEIAA